MVKQCSRPGQVSSGQSQENQVSFQGLVEAAARALLTYGMLELPATTRTS